MILMYTFVWTSQSVNEWACESIRVWVSCSLKKLPTVIIAGGPMGHLETQTWIYSPVHRYYTMIEGGVTSNRYPPYNHWAICTIFEFNYHSLQLQIIWRQHINLRNSIILLISWRLMIKPSLSQSWSHSMTISDILFGTKTKTKTKTRPNKKINEI